MKKDHTLPLADGEMLNITAYGENRGRHTPHIIYIHGFKGFKDWGFVPYLGRYLSDHGFYVITFNFSHNGIGNDPAEFTELEKFARNTLSREVRELSELIDAVKNGYLGPGGAPLGLLGHSRGGGIALVTMAKKNDVQAIAIWSSVATWSRYSDDIEQQWRRDGYYEVINQRTGQVMRLNVSLLEDIEHNGEGSLSIEKAVKNFSRPLLVVHGENDESVPVDEADRIYSWADPGKSDLVIIPGTGHTFDAKHPFEGTNPHLEKALSKTTEFFVKNI